MNTKKVKIKEDGVIVKHVTCPYCGTWITNMAQALDCPHFKEWDEEYAYFEEK